MAYAFSGWNRFGSDVAEDHASVALNLSGQEPHKRTGLQKAFAFFAWSDAEWATDFIVRS